MLLNDVSSNAKKRRIILFLFVLTFAFSSFLLFFATDTNKAFAANEIIYVKENANGDGSSWNNAIGTLQEALDQASAGDSIHIAHVLPYEKINYTSTFSYFPNEKQRVNLWWFCRG